MNENNFIILVERERILSKRSIFAKFTLVEMLLVVTIIAVLAAMLLPVLKLARDKANTVVCISNLRQLGISAHGYINDNNGYIIRASEDHLCKYEQNLYWLGYVSASKSRDKARPWRYLIRKSIFLCPSDPDPYIECVKPPYVDPDPNGLGIYTSHEINRFLGNYSNNGTPIKPKWVKVSQVVAPSKLIFIPDAAANSGWVEAADPDQSTRHIEYNHNNRAGVLFFDNHAKTEIMIEMLPFRGSMWYADNQQH